MNWDQIQGNWKKFEGQVKEKWGKLTNDDLTAISGKHERLLGKLQHAYGYGKDIAKKEIDDFLHAISIKDTAKSAASKSKVKSEADVQQGTTQPLDPSRHSTTPPAN